MKYLELFFGKFTKRVIGCPSCHRRIRFPIRPGKTLRVTCPSCLCMFDVSFKSKIFSGSQQKLLMDRIKQSLFNFKINKKRYLLIFVGLILSIYLANTFLFKTNQKKIDQFLIEKNNQIYEEL